MWYSRYTAALAEYERVRETLSELRRPLSRDVARMGGYWRACREVDRDTAIAVMLRIFSPRTLLSGQRLERGVVVPLSSVAGLTRSHTSKLCHDIYYRYRRLPRLRARVEEIALGVVREH